LLQHENLKLRLDLDVAPKFIDEFLFPKHSNEKQQSENRSGEYEKVQKSLRQIAQIGLQLQGLFFKMYIKTVAAFTIPANLDPF
jgi:hypothetical protein